MQVLGKHAAKHRSAETGQHPDSAEIGLVLAAFAGRDHVGNHGLHHRHDAATAKSLQAARENQDHYVRRQRAEHGTRDKQAERHDDHDTAAVDVAQRAEHGRDGGRGQEIGGDDPGQTRNVVELTADGRQRGRHNGLVQRGQEHREQQAHQDGSDLALRQRRAWRDRWRIGNRHHGCREFRQFARDRVRQRLVVGRITALPFKLVHREILLSKAPPAQRRFALSVAI